MNIEEVMEEMRLYAEDDHYDPDVGGWLIVLEAVMREKDAAIRKLNTQAEHFEREWYLRGDEIERLHEQVQDMIDASGQECGCGYDKPGDVCIGHWPAYKKQQDKINLLTRKVEHLSKNKCMGCIDAICDDCVPSPGTGDSLI